MRQYTNKEQTAKLIDALYYMVARLKEEGVYDDH